MLAVDASGAIAAIQQRAHGNPDVVAMLRRYLAAAEQGRFNHVAVIMCEPPRGVAMDLAGVVAMEPVAHRALEMMLENVAGRLSNRRLPPRNPALGADYACYDVANGPLSYDAIVWLIDREMDRVREGAPAPLKVAFWKGNDGNTGLEGPDQQLFFDNVVRPGLALVGAVEDDAAMLGRVSNVYTPHAIAAAVRAGEKPPVLKASPAATAEIAAWLDGRTPVTITLRESSQWPHRNSNIAAWIRFGDYLKERGESVVYVRDTAKASEPIQGCVTCPGASLDLHYRTALYAAAKANLFVGNGPAALANFSDKPWLEFINLDADGSVFYVNTPKYWRENMGTAQGEQWPWCREDQRIVWAADTYPNLVAAWEKWIAP